MSPSDIERALRGDSNAAAALCTALNPPIRIGVGKALRLSTIGNWMERRDDIIHEVYADLFSDDGKTLRSWDPARGGFEAFFTRIAYYRAISALRKKRNNPQEPEPDLEPEPEPRMAETPERRLAIGQELAAVVEDLEAGFRSERDKAMFTMLYLDQESVQTVCSALDVTPGAVYAWRNRLRKKAREFRERLEKGQNQ